MKKRRGRGVFGSIKANLGISSPEHVSSKSVRVGVKVADSVYNKGFAPLKKISPEKLQDEREKVANHR
ncbi:hypothetical protein [Bacillus wiedmannii]|uniref:hypothetical protein n=1 Tax=Bacillus wiedmannii TaxID=1890302 RepID=UPI000D08AA46|nr:hypothetical protein [Bacillus wiedmannii]PRT15102.1 hypothetical protein C6360_28670 [Bacillus wiedmannii]